MLIVSKVDFIARASFKIEEYFMMSVKFMCPKVMFSKYIK